MALNYVVRQGDCVASIAYSHGFHPKTIWSDPANSSLREQRGDPSVLMPGDVLLIPEKQIKQQACATDARHCFVRKGVPSKICLVLQDEDSKPRAGIQYVLEIDGRIFEGATDGSGRIERPIPPNARRGRLTVSPGTEAEEQFVLQLGCLDPVTEISGVQARLNNLGFRCGTADGTLNEQSRQQLLKFQASCQLPETGEPDQATQDQLKQQHGS